MKTQTSCTHALITSLVLQMLVGSTSVGQDRSEASNLQKENLVAWCIVPFDAKKRTPKQRAEMLDELGLKHLAYDWREEHVSSWDEELDALNDHDIALTAFWCSSSLAPVQDPGTKRILEFLTRRKVATELWIMLPDAELTKIVDQEERVLAAADAIRELAVEAKKINCKVGLYNHGGWVGRPSTLVRIMEQLKDLDNVGLVYNFHHAHDDMDAFPKALVEMKPYLLCLNLNGTTVGGPKILPIGAGELDSQILGWIAQCNYTGPVGILDHRDELDAQESLQLNLDGLEQLLKTLNTP